MNIDDEILQLRARVYVVERLVDRLEQIVDSLRSVRLVSPGEPTDKQLIDEEIRRLADSDEMQQLSFRDWLERKK